MAVIQAGDGAKAARANRNTDEERQQHYLAKRRSVRRKAGKDSGSGSDDSEESEPDFDQDFYDEVVERKKQEAQQEQPSAPAIRPQVSNKMIRMRSRRRQAVAVAHKSRSEMFLADIAMWKDRCLSLFVKNRGGAAPAARVRASWLDDDHSEEAAKSVVATAYRLPWPKVNQWRHRVWRVLSEPESSSLAFWISNVITAIVILTTVSEVVATLPEFSGDDCNRDVFDNIETVTVQVYSLELLLGVLTSPDLVAFAKGPLNWITFVSVLPWYIFKFTGAKSNRTSVLRVLRLARIFRMVRLSARLAKVQVIVTALRGSADLLLLMLLMLAGAMLMFSTFMYFAEGGDFDATLGYSVRPDEWFYNDDGTPEPSPFNSIPAGFWWCIVTLMTVGYGDAFPISVAGKIIAGVTMLCGIFCLSLPICIIGSNFTEEWMKHAPGSTKRKAVVPPNILRMETLLHNLQTEVSGIVRTCFTLFHDIDDVISELRSQIVAIGRKLGQRGSSVVRTVTLPTGLGRANTMDYLRKVVPTPEFSADDGWVSDVMTHIKESEHLSEELAHDRTPVLHDVVRLTRMLSSGHIKSVLQSLRSTFARSEELKAANKVLANSIAEVMDDLQDLDLRILAFRARHAQYLPAPSAGSSSGSDDGGGGNGDGGGGGGMRPSLSLDKAAAVTNDMVTSVTPGALRRLTAWGAESFHSGASGGSESCVKAAAQATAYEPVTRV